MARALVIEEESGTYTGDFSVSRSATVETALSASSRHLYVVPGFVAPSVTPTGGRPSAWPSDRPRAA
jgi:hypothetical protein